MSEEPQKPGFVKEKIKASNPKNRGVESRPRALGRRIIKRAEKKLKAALDKFPDKNVQAAINVLAGQLKATKGIWDVVGKCMIEIPDEKIRQDAALAILAYNWGTPIARSISAHADVSDFPDLLRRLAGSDAAKAIEDSESLQKTVEGKEIEPALPEPQREEH